MSTDPNQPSKLPKSASSAQSRTNQSRTKGQMNPAPEPSSPAEPMTDQPSNSTLAAPPTRIPASESAGSTNPPVPESVISTSSTAVPKSGTKPAALTEAPEPSESTELVAAAETLDNAESDASLDSSHASPQPEAADAISESVTPEPVSSEPASSEPVSSEPVSSEPASSEATSSETDIPESAIPEAASPEVTNSEVTSPEVINSESTSPEATSSEPSSSSAEAAPTESPAARAASLSRNQPIPPASEPMQYRAIGLVRGKYTPSEEQFTRGAIVTDDGVIIDAVLLGRVMSLVKKHIDLAESHLWVVYPRTREKNLELHMQIVGVWEPDKLNRMAEEDSAAEAADEDLEVDDAETDETEAAQTTEAAVEPAEPVAEAAPAEPEVEPALLASEPAEPASQPDRATADDPGTDSDSVNQEIAGANDDLDDCYFSVRGEVVFQAEEDERLLVKIRRAPKPGETEGKAFKVALKGILAGKALGYFWDMQVRRTGTDLIVQEATQIGMVPPQKRKPGGGRRGPGGKPTRRGAGGPPRRNGQAAGPPRRRWDNREGGREPGREGGRENRPYRSERPATPAPSAPRQPVAKPVKRQKEEPST